MLQTLLAERFQLSLHRELREMPVYDLIVTKPGKMKLSEDQSLPVPPPVTADFRWSALSATHQRGTSGMVFNAEGTSLQGTAISSSAIATLLQTVVDRPVLDKTGLTGLFDMQVLILTREDVRPVSRPAVTAAPGLPPIASEPRPNPTFESLQEEMGLRLQPSKRDVSVLVIDSVSRPSEN